MKTLQKMRMKDEEVAVIYLVSVVANYTRYTWMGYSIFFCFSKVKKPQLGNSSYYLE